MAAKHGSRWGYKTGCRCAQCRDAQAAYQRGYRARVLMGETRPRPSVVPPVAPDVAEPGRVEMAVATELEGLPAADSRPGLAALALAMGRVLDHPRALSSKPAAARQLARFLDDLHKGSAARRGGLSVVRQMTEKGG